MLENCQSAQERWGGVTDIIDRWLKERQQMLVQYCNLSDLLEADDDLDSELPAKRLQSLCQILVDYISAGHFEVYTQLVKEGQDLDDFEGLEKSKKLMHKIDSTTEYVLDFNDKYQETDDLTSLSTDLSILGENLAHRFEAEDSMIEVLHLSHQQQFV